MSRYGICFDEGMSGHCGLECRGHEENECTATEEILENCSYNDILDNGQFDEYLIEKYIPIMTQEIIKQQTVRDYTLLDHLEKMREK